MPTINQLVRKGRKAIAKNQEGKPALIEVMTKEEETVSRFTQGY